MLSNVAVCPLASVILVLVIIINVLDIYLVGFQFAIIATNLLISVFFVWLANKTCYKYHWVSWLITAYFVICIIGALAIISNPALLNQKGMEEIKKKTDEAGRVKA
jgi:membrane protease YdiL (CAAX protease family)